VRQAYSWGVELSSRDSYCSTANGAMHGSYKVVSMLFIAKAVLG